MEMKKEEEVAVVAVKKEQPLTTTPSAPAAPAPSEHGGTPAVAVVMAAAFTNICVYGVEWCLYALYFRRQYGWSGAWCGFAQMVGDLIAAAVLGVSTMACLATAVTAGGCCALPRWLSAGLRPPFSLAVLSVCHSVLLVMLAQPHFAVALAGQVLMGTVYVFYEQGCQVRSGPSLFHRAVCSAQYEAHACPVARSYCCFTPAATMITTASWWPCTTTSSPPAAPFAPPSPTGCMRPTAAASSPPKAPLPMTELMGRRALPSALCSTPLRSSSVWSAWGFGSSSSAGRW